MTKLNPSAYHAGESEADNSQTPDWLIERLQEAVNVQIIHDVCATDESTKNRSSYWTIENDALQQNWSELYVFRQRNSWHERGSNSAFWMNPPFSKAKQFTEKAHIESKLGGVVTLGCVKHAPDADWFQKVEEQATFIYVPDGRIQFLRHDGSPFTRFDKKSGKEVRSGANFPICFPLWTPFNNGGQAKFVRFKRKEP